jgi:hypothetical protein
MSSSGGGSRLRAIGYMLLAIYLIVVGIGLYDLVTFTPTGLN